MDNFSNHTSNLLHEKTAVPRGFMFFMDFLSFLSLYHKVQHVLIVAILIFD